MGGPSRYSSRSGSLAEISDYGFSGKSSTLNDFPFKAPEMELSRPKTMESQHSDTVRTVESPKDPPADDHGDEKRSNLQTDGAPAQDSNAQMQEADPKIHVRKLVQWRAKLPKAEPSAPIEPEMEGPPCENDDVEKGVRRQGTGGTLRRLVGRQGTAIEPVASTKTIEIALHWHIDDTNEKKDEGKTAFGIYVSPKTTDPCRRDRLTWHHRPAEVKSVEQMKGMVRDCKACSLPEDVEGLAQRLLRRVTTDAQREFINGSYLVPYAHRYDGQHDSREQADISCLFVNFPYICIRKYFALHGLAKRGDGQHPVRTLLQSKFRLSKTTERDKQQSLKLLDATELEKACVLPEGSRYKKKRHDHSRVQEKIFVPQLWAMIVGSGTLITNGPLDDSCLRGTALTSTWAKRGLSIIRIRVFPDAEYYTYPLDQCNSWFGLMKKQRDIVRKHRSQSSADQRNEIYGDYLLYVDSRLGAAAHGNGATPADSVASSNRSAIESQNWGLTLENWKNEETLGLVLMERRAVAAKPTEQGDGSLNVPGSPRDQVSLAPPNHPEHGNQGYTPYPGHRCVDWPELKKQPEISTVPPFLEWPMLDQFGEQLETDCSSSRGRAERLLGDIMRRPDADTSDAPQNALVSVSDHDPFFSELGDLRMLGLDLLSIEELEEKCRNRQLSKETEQAQDGDDEDGDVAIEGPQSGPARHELEQDFISRCKDLMGMFVSSEMFNGNVPAIQLFWGAVACLLFGATYSPNISDQGLRDDNLEEFTRILAGIAWHARKLRVGVQRTVLKIDTEEFPQNKEQGLVLLEKMVSALRSIFRLIFKAAREVRGREGLVDSVFRPDPQNSLYMGEARRACELLDTAREELIQEADGKAQQSLGSVVTPETILTILMDRLSKGVYGDGSVDFIELYEQCLQKLTEAVESGASRRLLKQINCFQEEIDLISDVLRDQDKVLGDFDELLRPGSFDNASPLREERYDGEHSLIDRVRAGLKERMNFCTELADRSRRLARQNVELVEASADQSGRSIVIFTVVTIIFLPPTFVAGFFGMNVKGISGTTGTFWRIAGGTTAGVVVFTIACLIWGEAFILWFASLPWKATRLWRRLSAKLQA